MRRPSIRVALVACAALMLGGCLNPSATPQTPASASRANVGPCPAPPPDHNLVIRAIHRDDPSFELNDVAIALDGRGLYTPAHPAELQAPERLVVAPTVAPGPHVLQTLHRLHGRGVGSFAYLNGYRFDVRSDHPFQVVAGKPACVSVILDFSHDPQVPFQQRPRIEFRDD